MYEIDLGTSAVFNVKVNGKEIELREPLTGELKQYAKDIEKNGDENSTEVFLDFVVALGMPRELAETLGAIRIKKLSEGILGGLAEKK